MRLKPCPWCKKTPELWMPVNDDTWKWEIVCRTQECKMKPRSPHVSIRKTTKESIEKIAEKLAILAEMWNSGNDCVAFEYKIVDTGPIMSGYKEPENCFTSRMRSQQGQMASVQRDYNLEKEVCDLGHLRHLHEEYNRAYKAWDDAFDQHKKFQEQSKTKKFTLPYRYF